MTKACLGFGLTNPPMPIGNVVFVGFKMDAIDMVVKRYRFLTLKCKHYIIAVTHKT